MLLGLSVIAWKAGRGHVFDALEDEFAIMAALIRERTAAGLSQSEIAAFWVRRALFSVRRVADGLPDVVQIEALHSCHTL